MCCWKAWHVAWFPRDWNEHGCINACISGMEGMWMVGGLPALGARFGSEFTRAAAGIKVSEGGQDNKRPNKEI